MYKHVHVLNICINGLTNNCTKKPGHCNKSLCIYTYIGFLKNLGKGISNSNLSSRKYIFFFKFKVMFIKLRLWRVHYDFTLVHACFFHLHPYSDTLKNELSV